MPIDLQLYDIKNLKNKVYYQGNNVKIYNFERKDHELIQRKEMIKLCKALQSDLKELYEDGLISISIKYPNRWYSSDVSKLNQSINFFTMNDYDEFDEDPEEYEQFRIHFLPIKAKSEGGNDEHNDCLINCIKKIVQTFKNDINAEELKQILGLDRDAKIPIAKLSEVEKYINDKTQMLYAINVSGDAEYISTIQTNKKINLLLSNEHYSMDISKFSKQIRKTRNERPIVMTEFLGDEVNAYDGEHCFVMSKEDYKEYNSHNKDKLMVEKNFSVKTKNMCIEDAYETYIEMADDLKDKSNGVFNMYKCGSIKHLALNYFYEKNKSIQPEPIQNNEAEWIEKASFSAITYWIKYAGTVYSYDVNSHYPNVMTKNFHYFPIKEGEFTSISEISKKVQYGIYRCIISKLDNKPYKFFKFNDKNYYTHTSIEDARKYGLQVELIIDDQPNFLYYSQDKLMNGSFLFKHYVDEIYKLKIAKAKGAKDLLNILWGALCQTNYKRYVASSTDEVHIDDAQIKSISSDDKIRIKTVSYKYGYYETNWARIKPFVLSYGRTNMFNRFQKYEDWVVRIHTDGFYLTSEPDDIEIKDGLGYLKNEGEKHINLTGINKLK